MGLYSSFNPSQYYDEPVAQKAAPTQPQTTPTVDYKKPHQVAPGLTEQRRKSLYEEAQKVASTKEATKGPDFREIYRVGQMIRVQGQNGKLRTAKGRIVEIVDRDLMYVGMEDSYKDVNDNWLIDFVTKVDIITKL